MTREDVAVFVKGIAPVVRKTVGDALADLASVVSALALRVHAVETRDLVPGPPGRDGTDGKPGTDGAPGPRGECGADGIDAFDFEPTYDGERTLTLTWTKGERVETRTFVMPVVLYRGVWTEGQAYEAGDQVTWGGAQWIARSATTARCGLNAPESRAWTLACKAGRDGKPGKDGTDGRHGRDGKDYGVWPQRS